MTNFFYGSVVLLLFTISACKQRGFELQQIPRVATNQIDKVRFQQIFLSFNEINPLQPRGKKETAELAKKIFHDLQKRPSDFPDRVREFSEDRFPAVYTLANYGQKALEGERERDDFFPAIGLQVFTLKIGEVALIPYDKEASPAGFHIVMRLPL